MDALLLSRLQFALNISFHILFPTITIALGWFLFYFKLRSNLSGHPVWMRIYRFWVRVFALTFALGVVSGVTMSFQFGTNWPGFMEKAGNIAGPLLGYEVLTAFFLEATFLGIMLFGMRRVPNWLHTLATFVVAAGTTLSAFWILSLNSWLHTPQGHEVIDGVIYAKDWSAIIFNPSFPYRFSHMLLASGLTASFLIAGLSAYRLLIGDNKIAPKLALKTATYTAAVLIPLQILAGDMHGLNTLEHQPQKVAAMEGVWETEQGAPLLLFAIPDEQERTNHAELAIPNLASFILTHELDGEIKGLNEFRGEHPPVAPVFYSFRVMVGMGVLMLFAAWAGAYYLFRRGELPDWLRKLFIAMSFSGWVATLAGWYVTEVGRQPYLVSGVLRTADAVTGLPSHNIGLSFTLYALIYAVLMVAYIRTLTLMCRKSVGIEEISKGDADQRQTNKLDIASNNVQEPDMPFESLSVTALGNIYLGLLALAVLLYAILDGYDLGVGVLFPPHNEQFKDDMIASIGPYWDANETWLVLAVGILLIAFPEAHSQILQTLYLPATFMLLGLILRGVSFDFRAKVPHNKKPKWDTCFKYGSILTTLSQGYMLGIWVTGLRTDIYAQGFALLAAFGVTAAYAFIGACWLILKSEGDLQAKAFYWAKRCLLVLASGILAVSLLNLTLHDEVRVLWLESPVGWVLMTIPLTCFALLLLCSVVLKKLPEAGGKGEWLPFAIALLIFGLCFAAFGISYYPYVVPGKLAFMDVLSDGNSLRFLLVGAVVVVPCILAYTVLVYRIFAGKSEKLSYY